MDDRLTREMLRDAIETFKRYCVAESKNRFTCDICGKTIYGYWVRLDLPDKQFAIIHGELHCFKKALETIRKAEEDG